MTDTLFDTRTLDPGTRSRFAEDQYAPFRIVVHRWVPVDRGPAITYDELTAVLVKQLVAYGVTVHGFRSELEEPEGLRWPRGHWAVIECSLIATSHAHANELLEGLADRALAELDKQWEWFDRNPASKWSPR